MSNRNGNSRTPGIINIHGKQYKTVALRVSEFRNLCPAKDGWGLTAEIISANAEGVTIVAKITHPDGKVVATGFAEEMRTKTGVNKTSALENAETSAIGRALSAFGLAGDEYCSADELLRALKLKEESSTPSPKPSKSPAADEIGIGSLPADDLPHVDRSSAHKKAPRFDIWPQTITLPSGYKLEKGVDVADAPRYILKEAAQETRSDEWREAIQAVYEEKTLEKMWHVDRVRGHIEALNILNADANEMALYYVSGNAEHKEEISIEMRDRLFNRLCDVLLPGDILEDKDACRLMLEVDARRWSIPQKQEKFWKHYIESIKRRQESEVVA